MFYLTKLQNYLINNWAVLCVLALVISLGVGVRFLLLEKHFAHVDDIGVAVTILDRQEYLSTIEERFDEWRVDVLNGEMGSSVESIARTLDEMSVLKEVVYSGLWWRNFLHGIPNGWTYAPGQFYLTNFLVNADQNYSEIKFWGRAPSLLFNIAAIGLLILFYYQICENKSAIKYSVVGVTILSLSWENIIYSAQMESSEINTFAMLFIFLLLIYIIRLPVISNRKAYFRGVILAIPGLLQYQALFFILPLYIALLLYLRNRANLFDIVKNSFFTFLGFLTLFVLFIFPYLKDSAGRGITWNSGPNKEFVLSPNWGGEYSSIFLEITNFFLINIPLVIEAMLTPISFYTQDNNFFGWVFFVVSLIGLISMFISKNIEKRILAIFFLISLFIWAVLIFLQIFPLSPTRHSIVLGSIFLILFVEGLFSFERYIKISLFKSTIGGLSFIPFCFALTWLSLFINTLDSGIENRIDPFNEVDIYESLNQDQVDVVVVFDYTLQLILMPSITSKFPTLYATAWKTDGSIPISNYGKDDKHLEGKKSLRVAVISSWGCFKLQDKRSIELINGVILKRYNLNSEHTDLSILEQSCSKSNVEIEWSPLTRNGQNTFNYTILEIFS